LPFSLNIVHETSVRRCRLHALSQMENSY
jgi:hypothetical protein